MSLHGVLAGALLTLPYRSTDFGMPGSYTSSSFEHSKLLQALSSSSDNCSNYTCCGLPLTDLHALLDHFEESHVLVLDHQSLQAANAQVASQQASKGYDELPMGNMEMDDVDDMEMEGSDTPGSSSASSQSNSPHLGDHSTLSTPNPGQALNLSINPYYADYRTLLGSSSGRNNSDGLSSPTSQQCIPPALLFSPAPSPSINRTHSSEAPTSPVTPKPSTTSADPPSSPSSDSAELTISGPGIIHPGPPPPSAAPTSLAKPFKCPTPNCNKSYKQANGLKYHLTHGQCCFIPKDPALDGLDELEKDKVERPFGCGVGGCERRYKNMNGLRYHYQHSGAHGAVGLALLSAGTHSVQLAAANASLGRSAKSSSGKHQGSPSDGPIRSGSVSSAGGLSRASSVASVSSTSTAKPTTPGAPGSPSNPSTPRAIPTSPTSVGPQSPTRPTTTQGSGISRTGIQPPLPSTQPGYPYLPQYNTSGVYGTGQPLSYAATVQRQPVFPPHHPQGHMTSAIAAMAGAFGGPYASNSHAQAIPQQQQSIPQRPHQLLRTNSNSGSSPTLSSPAPAATTAKAVTATSSGTSTDMDMDMDMME
ncbi:hypothetical protein FRC03_007290 [Tulasnella sp. 419]|nr:hypothetical protein FRC02_003369 [Tulasnella sp. 418]KAG8959920.1 hypothetical protein FRC03_007290 [Tulasnella sp. 419]